MNSYKISHGLLALFLLLSSVALAQKITSKSDSLHYALGVVIFNDLKSLGVDQVGFDKVMQTVKNHYEDGEKEMSVDIARAVIERFRKDHHKKTGISFLEKNKLRPGVKTTPSGLQYEVLKQTNSKRRPSSNSEVKAHYTGTLTDGSVFDSSVDRDQAFVFYVNRVIKGWQEGIMLMEEGDKFRFYIPEYLAYGEKGAGNRIPPFSTLIFEVELLEVLSNPVLVATE